MDYARYHQHRVNLLIHLVAVPVFVFCAVGVAWSLVAGLWWQALAFAAGIGLSLAVQGRGHRLEAVPPEPFAGPLDFVRRIVLEQFGRFWGYLFSGGWLRALRHE